MFDIRFVTLKFSEETGRKEVFYSMMQTTHLVMVIWGRTYGIGPFRVRERKPAAATWATLSD